MSAFTSVPAAAPRARVHLHLPRPAPTASSWCAPASACDALGCAVDAPAPLPRGSRVFVELVDERVGPPVFLLAHVRSCDEAPPFHAEVEFSTRAMLTALRFF